MSRGAFLIPKLSVLGNRQAEAVQMLVSKGLSTITNYQASFVESVLEYLKRHQSRTQRDLALEIIEELSRSSDPPFYFIDRGTEARITVTNTQVDISTDAKVKVYWNYNGTAIASTATATVGNVYSSEVQIQDFPLYHGNFYKLDVLYEDGTDRYPITSLYVVVKTSKSVDSALLPAPALVSAIVAGDGKSVAFTWTNPTHRDYKFTQLRTSDGLLLYRGNLTTYTWYSDKTGSENFKLYAEGPGGHTVASAVFGVDGLVLDTVNVVAGGVNLITLAKAQTASFDTNRNIFFFEGDPIQEAWTFGQVDARTEGTEVGNSLSFSAGEWVLSTANYVYVNGYGYAFRFEVDDCDGLCVYSSGDHLRSFGEVLMLIFPANSNTIFTVGTSYTYRVMVTDPTSSATQQLVTGCLMKLACPDIPEDVPPNDHYVLTKTTSAAAAVAAASTDCGCN